MEKYHQLLKEIFEEEGIDYTFLSDEFIIKLQKNSKIKYIYGYKFPLNNQGVSLVLDDKYAFYSILNQEKIPTIKVIPIYKNYDLNILLNELEKYKNLIVKSNNGTCGNNVFKITTKEDLINKIDLLLEKNSPVCVSPYIEIKNEYRVIVLNKKIKLIYGKKRPIIIGDGHHTILEILQEFNPYFFSKKDIIKDKSLQTILKNGESYEFDFRFNLSKGSIIFDVNSSLKKELSYLANQVAEKLDIQFASIDIVETNTNQLFILEANSGIMMDNFIMLHQNGYLLAKDIYRDAIKTLFK